MTKAHHLLIPRIKRKFTSAFHFFVIVYSIIAGKEKIFILSYFDRLRYLRLYYPETSMVRILICRRHRLIIRVLKLLGRKYIISSDIVFKNSSFFKNYKGTLRVFIWNDESEISGVSQILGDKEIEFISPFKLKTHWLNPGDKLTQLSIIPVHNITLTSTAFGYSLNFPKVLFVGAVDLTFYAQFFKKDAYADELRKFVCARILEEGPFHLFDSDFIFSNRLNLEQYIAIRHYAINYWRLELLTNISLSIGKDLMLVGNSLLRPELEKARQIPSIEDPNSLYQAARFNLDLGSQCGLEYQYGRSLEIYACNPNSHITFRRLGGEAFPGSILVKSLPELVALLRN
jgi:hypothetical protein